MPVTRSRRPPRSPLRANANEPHDSSQQGIRSFTRTTKPGLSRPLKAVSEKTCLLSDQDAAAHSTGTQSVNGSRKRKTLHSTDANDPPALSNGTKRPRNHSDGVEPVDRLDVLETPRKKTSNPQGLPTPVQTPNYSSRSLWPTPTKRHALSENDVPATPESKTHSPRDVSESLPEELYNLIDLNTAFLKSLSLHFAHHGTTSPADLRNLMPSVSKTWGRRRVVLVDIKRTLGILQSAMTDSSLLRQGQAEIGADLQLYEYGSNNIYLEKLESASSNGRFAPPLNEEVLNALFESNLTKLWRDFRKSERGLSSSRSAGTGSNDCMTPHQILLFVESLPQAPTPAHPSIQKSTTAKSLTLGQTRLTDLTSFAQKKKSSVSTTPKKPNDDIEDFKSNNLKTPTQDSKNVRTSSLLSRLQAKSKASALLQRSLPSDAEVTRSAALQRVPEVVAILSLLRGSSLSSSSGAATVHNDNAAQHIATEMSPSTTTSSTTRQTYSLPSLIQLIRESSRSAVSSVEVERCLEILADVDEGVAGKGFVRIVKVGGDNAAFSPSSLSLSGSVIGVIVDVSKRVPLVDVRANVGRLLGTAP